MSDDDARDDDGIAGDGDAVDEVPQDPEQDETTVPRAVCPEALPSTTPVQLAADVNTRTVKVGPCGHLAFTDAQKNLHLLDASYTRELREPAIGSALEFSPDGALFLGSGGDNVLLQDLVSEESFAIPGSQAGFLLEDERWDEPVAEPRSVAFVQDELGTGLVRNGKIASRLGTGEGYVRSWSRLGARVLIEDATHGMRVLDFAHGTESAPELALVGGQGEFGGHDVIEMSADGELLFHVAVDDEPCGDTVCTHADTATVLELARANRKHSLPANAEYELDMLDSSPYVALMGPDALTLMITGSGLETQTHQGYRALAILPEHGQALAVAPASSALALIDFGADGKVTTLASTSVLQSSPTSYVKASRAGSAIAFARPPDDCVGKKDDPHGCHTQIWPLQVWTREHGVLQTYHASQPLEPLWVGEDGSVLIAGDLIGEVPEFADAPFQGEHGLHLLGPDGKERANLPFGLITLIERERDLLVVTADGTHRTLGLLEPSTGALHKLDELDTAIAPPNGDYPWIDLYLDRAQKRLVYVKNWHEGDFVSRNSLHALALPE